MSLKKIFLNALPLILGVGLIGYSLSNLTAGDFIQIKKTFENVKYEWVLFSLLLGFLSHFLRAYRWKFILNPMGYYPKIKNSLMAVFIAYLVNLGIPRAGEISRAAVMKSYEEIPFEKAFGTIIAERVADIIIFLMLIVLSFTLQYNFILDLMLSKIPKNVYIFLAISLGFFIMGFFIFRKIKRSKNIVLVKIKNFCYGFLEGIESILTMKKKWSFIGYTLLIWILYIGMLVTVSFAIEATKNLSLSAILICFIVGTLSYAFTNGGIGSYPLAIEGVLLMYGISKIDGLSFGWLMWASQTLMILFFGGLSFLLLPILNRK